MNALFAIQQQCIDNHNVSSAAHDVRSTTIRMF